MTPDMLRRIRLILWALVALAALVATAIFFLAPPKSPSALGGGDYRVMDPQGNTLDASMFKGHPSLLFFGYTHCPDVCPTTLAEMASWFEALGDEGKNLRGYFVTVDPERDPPEVLANYVSAVTDRVTPISGNPAEVMKLADAWKVAIEKVPGGEGGEYTMNHTASVFLINKDGGFEGTIAYGENADTAIEKIRKLLAKG